MTRKSPVHLNIEKDQPVHLVLTPTKSKVVAFIDPIPTSF